MARALLHSRERSLQRSADPSHWRLEAFDAFDFPVARKTGPYDAEFRGAGLLLAAEIWTPVQVRLRVDAATDAIVWGRCQADGRRADHAQLRELLVAVAQHPDRIPWAFSADYPNGTD